MVVHQSTYWILEGGEKHLKKKKCQSKKGEEEGGEAGNRNCIRRLLKEILEGLKQRIERKWFGGTSRIIKP